MTIEVLSHNLATDASPNGEIPTQQHPAIAKCAELATLIDRHTDSKGGIYHSTAIDALVFCDAILVKPSKRSANRCSLWWCRAKRNYR
jgi:hypothetical protein